MEEIVSITFEDANSGDEALVFVRVHGQTVALSVSLRSDGDYLVALNPGDCETLAEALRRAVAQARSY